MYSFVLGALTDQQATLHSQCIQGQHPYNYSDISGIHHSVLFIVVLISTVTELWKHQRFYYTHLILRRAGIYQNCFVLRIHKRKFVKILPGISTGVSAVSNSTRPHFTPTSYLSSSSAIDLLLNLNLFAGGKCTLLRLISWIGKFTFESPGYVSRANPI